MTLFDLLASDQIRSILAALPVEDLAWAAAVCSTFADGARQSHLWREHVLRRWPWAAAADSGSADANPQLGTSWKCSYGVLATKITRLREKRQRKLLRQLQLSRDFLRTVQQAPQLMQTQNYLVRLNLGSRSFLYTAAQLVQIGSDEEIKARSAPGNASRAPPPSQLTAPCGFSLPGACRRGHWPGRGGVDHQAGTRVQRAV